MEREPWPPLYPALGRSSPLARPPILMATFATGQAQATSTAPRAAGGREWCNEHLGSVRRHMLIPAKDDSTLTDKEVDKAHKKSRGPARMC